MTERHRSSAEAAGPFAWMSAMPTPPFWTAFGACAKAAEPVARSAARAQLEMSSLVGTRAKAWAAIPQTLAHCRTPVDLLQAQMAFWQEAGRNYADASQHVLAAWGNAATGGFGTAPAERVERRDFITFPEPKPEPVADDRRHPGDQRRAA